MVSDPYMEARAGTSGGASVVTVSGEVDMATAPELSQVISEALEQDTGCLVIDLLDVSFMDSSGLGALVSARQSRPELDIALVVAGGVVRKAIETTGLDQMFRMATDLEAAIPGKSSGEEHP